MADKNRANELESEPPRSDAAGRRAAEREIDEMAASGPKTKWQEPHMPAAGDPVTELERKGLDLLGRSSVRDGAISGVSDPTAGERAELELHEDHGAAELDQEGGSPAE